jgi:hypothetical protein
VALRGLESATFKRPVAIGDTIRVRCRVEGTRPLDDANELVELAFRVVNQDDRAVALARIHAVCRRGPDPWLDATVRDADDTGESEPSTAAREPSARADGKGFWPDEYRQLYGGETFL